MTDPVAAHGRATIAKGSKSFALASKLLPADVRDDAVKLYAWCRYADDLIDGQALGHGPIAARGGDEAARLAELTAATERALAGRPDPHPAFEGLAQVVARHQIPHRHPRELLRGFGMDVAGRYYDSLDDTLDYCYHVAGAVGVMLGYIMGVRDDSTLDRASDLGLAFQLSNIARDVMEDARGGRVYLPGAWLAEKAVPAAPQAIVDAANQAAVFAVVVRLLETAEQYYESANSGIAVLPFGCAYGTGAAARVYRAINTQRLRLGPEGLSERVIIGPFTKLRLAASAFPGRIRQQTARPDHLYRRPMGAACQFSSDLPAQKQKS